MCLEARTPGVQIPFPITNNIRIKVSATICQPDCIRGSPTYLAELLGSALIHVSVAWEVCRGGGGGGGVVLHLWSPPQGQEDKEEADRGVGLRQQGPLSLPGRLQKLISI